mgnify:CR=1 FL=1
MDLELYHLVAKAYTELDAELLIQALSDDCVYESQMVLVPLEGKEAIADLLRGKFKAIKEAGSHVSGSVRRVRTGAIAGAINKPGIVLRQRYTDAVVLLKLSPTNKVSRIDLCIVPAPGNTSTTH